MYATARASFLTHTHDERLAKLLTSYMIKKRLSILLKARASTSSHALMINPDYRFQITEQKVSEKDCPKNWPNWLGYKKKL